MSNVYLFAASYLPDVIDKTIAIIFGMSGRGYFHSLTVMLGLYALSYKIISKVRPDYKVFIHLGALYYFLHLMFDFLDLKILLWPFLGPTQYTGHFAPLEHLYNYYVSWQHPDQLSSEIIFIAILIIIKIRDLKAVTGTHSKTD
ncbi:MAG: hypothetical protein HQK99_16865 [Nitrospirae bacterium]|nr:hypothetical protein [Nitrospirota bacterium]